MSFAREFEKVFSRKFEGVTGKLVGTDRRRFSTAAYHLGIARSYQLANPRTARAHDTDVESALLSLESIGAEAAFDVRRAAAEALAEVASAALRIGLAVA